MLVEDDEDDIFLFKEVLSGDHNEIDIIVVADGLEAISILEEPLLADIIFMDINMPLMNGIECLRKIKNRYKSVPIIMLTTSDDKSLIKQVKQVGSSGFITKPTAFEKLQSVIEEVLSIDWNKFEDCFYLNIKQDTILS